MAVITIGWCDMGDRDCFVCESVRASRSSELGGFITACRLLIYTQALVTNPSSNLKPTPTLMPAAYVCSVSRVSTAEASNPSG